MSTPSSRTEPPSTSYQRSSSATTVDLPPPLGPLALRGIFGGLVAFGSFGSVMLATRLDQVGEAAVLRETSTVFAALIFAIKGTAGG